MRRLLPLALVIGTLLVPASLPGTGPAVAADRAGDLTSLGPVFFRVTHTEEFEDVAVPYAFTPPTGTGWTWHAQVQVWRDDVFVGTIRSDDPETGAPTYRFGAPSYLGGAAFGFEQNPRDTYTLGPSTVTIDYTDGRSDETFVDDTRGQLVIKDETDVVLKARRPRATSPYVAMSARVRNGASDAPVTAGLVRIQVQTPAGSWRTVRRAITGFDGVARTRVYAPRKHTYRAVAEAGRTTYGATGTAVVVLRRR